MQQNNNHQQTSESLKQCKKLFRKLFEYAPHAYFIADPKGTFIDGNRAAEKLTGYQRQECIGKTLFDLKLLDDCQFPLALQLLAPKTADTTTGPDTFLLTPRAGTKIPVEIITFPFTGNGQQTLRGMAINVTDPKRSCDALLESQKRLSDIIQRISIPTMVIDADHVVTHWNSAMEMISGLAGDNVIGTKTYNWAFSSKKVPSLSDLIVDGKTEKDIKAIYGEGIKKSAIADGAIEYEFLNDKCLGRDTYLFATAAPLHSEDGTVVGAIETLQDVTAMKAAEIALKASESQFMAIAESSPEAILMTDEDYNVLYFNTAAEKMFGYSRNAILGEPASILTPLWRLQNPNHKPENNSVDGIEPFTGLMYESVSLRKDGRSFPVELSISYWTLEDKNYFSLIFRDITERKLAEKKLRQARDDLEATVHERTAHLEEANIALNVLLKGRDEDRAEHDQQIVFSIKELILPYIEKLKSSGITETQQRYIDIIENNLAEMISPIMRGISIEKLKLSPKETKVANLIKIGKSTPEIAAILKCSTRTVECHRSSIRHKIGISNKKVNLRSYLMSLPEDENIETGTV
ncbi:PAS domain S-box protein [Thermodesulfobacteriota bacterium]